MKKTALSIALGLSIAMMGCTHADSIISDSFEKQTTSSTANVLCDYQVNEYNDSASVKAQSIANWSCEGGNRLLSGNGIPNHEVGTFPNAGNPNRISEQNVSATLPLTPTASGKSDGKTIAIAYALNSVKIEPNTDGSCGDTLSTCTVAQGRDKWRIEALGQSTFDFGTDMNNAHVQPTGEYHYHGMPEKLIEKLGGNKDKMTLVAWALDGYPIYARYGYENANDARSKVVALKGSYQLKNTPDSGRISTTELPMGTFAQDYEYVSGLSDLDDCNGRSGVTPEFPNGTYYYMFTDTYPFAPRCLKGEFTPVMFSEGDPNAGGANASGPSPDDLMLVMDANKDGKLAQSEVRGPLKNDFSKIDSNGDGFISEDELKSLPKPKH